LSPESGIGTLNKLILQAYWALEKAQELQVEELPYDETFLDVTQTKVRSLSATDITQLQAVMSKFVAQKRKLDGDSLAGIIAAIALEIVFLTGYDMMGNSAKGFRQSVNRRIARYSRMPSDDFDQVFDGWSQAVGGFQKFIERHPRRLE